MQQLPEMEMPMLEPAPGYLILLLFALMLGLVALLFLVAVKRSLPAAILVGLLIFAPLLVALSAGMVPETLARLLEPLFVAGAFFLVFLIMVRIARSPNFQFRKVGYHSCPPVARLKDFLAERRPAKEFAELSRHLDTCAACQHRLEKMTAGKKSWPDLANQLAQQRLHHDPALRQVMDNLKRDQDPGATCDEPAFRNQEPLGFLSPPDKPDQIGRFGPYEVVSEIGRGGMGIVLKAFDPSLHRVVAIKVLAPQLATSGVARKRFLREAQAAAAVIHDHIVTIHAVEEANGLPYIVMQFVPGVSLQERIDKEGPLELKEILRIGMQTAAGLAAAHAQGIVHRDIKPANILLENGVQRVKITDFGLARAIDDANLTGSGFVAGSPQYMAPEQARGDALDHRADLFSLGSVLYTLCTGRPPFRAANTFAVLRRVSEETPRPIREVNANVPAWLAAIVVKLHAKDPAERFQSAAEVADLFGQHLAQLQQPGGAPVPILTPSSPPPSAAGLLTSLTICPSCGAQLHVPEKMVGETVHCAECGKPFRVEDGSEEIQIARAVKPAAVRSSEARRGSSIRVWLLIGGALLLLLCCSLGWFALYFARFESASQHGSPAASAATVEPAFEYGSRLPTNPDEKRLKDALRWFPEGAILFGAMDLRPFGSLRSDDEVPQAILRLTSPPETRKMLTPKNGGWVRIDNVSFAYYADTGKPDKSNLCLQFQGIQDDLNLREVISKAYPEFKGSQVYNRLHLRSSQLPFAIDFVRDNRVLLAIFANDLAKVGNPKSFGQFLGTGSDSFGDSPPEKNILTGYNPPWLEAALEKKNSNTCGLLMGELPENWRKLLTEKLKLPACPRTVEIRLSKLTQTGDVRMEWTLNLDKRGPDQALLEYLQQWQRQAPEMLKKLAPKLVTTPASLNLAQQVLARAHLEAKDGSVRGRVDISSQAMRAFSDVLKEISLVKAKGAQEP